MSRMLRAPRAAALVALLTLILSGCRLDLVAPIEITPDGAATAGLSVRFDARMLAELDALGVDPTAELGAAVAADPAWQLVRTREEGGELVVALTRRLPDPAAVGQVYRDLVAGLSPEDPALVLDVEVEPLEDGGHRVSGTALLRPPTTSGLEVDGEPIGPDAQELESLVAEHVTAAVEVRFPGEVVSHDGVALDRTSVRFDLEPGRSRALTAVGAPTAWWARLALDTTTWLVLVGGLVLLVGAGLVLGARRRTTSAG
ncbi:MAG: LppM family (lipo)protein [Nitriliruptoraceae bacterium]